MDKQFAINIDDFTDEVFYELERIADDSRNHTATFKSKTIYGAANIIAERLLPFLQKQLKEVSVTDDNEWMPNG